MAKLSIDRRGPTGVTRLRLETDGRLERQAVASHPALMWSPSHGWFTLPPDRMVLDTLMQRLYQQARVDKLGMSDDAWRWWAMTVDQEQRALIAAALDDARLARAPFADRLYPYQRVGAHWLETVGRGILGDDPGLGKTVQALAAVRDDDNVLIVCPNVVKRHWAHHAQAWIGRAIAVCEGSHRERQRVLDSQPPWMVVNHEMLRVTGAGVYQGLRSRHWDAVVVDEAHKLQGRHSQQSHGAAMLHTDRLYLLTGTPIWNKPESLWHLLHLLDPARFASYWRWVTEFMDTVQNPWTTEIIGVKPAMVPRLQQTIAPLLLRRTKEDVLPQLPAKIIQTVEWEPTAAQRRALRKIKRELRHEDMVTGGVTVYANAAAALVGLRMALNMPTSCGILGGSPKTEALDGLLDTLLGERRKIVVYTWHRRYANYLAEHWAAHGTLLATGDTPEREHVIEHFALGTAPILVATIAAVGLGVNLQFATAAIFAEGSYVWTQNQQAEDRLHRIGTTDAPLIYRMMAPRTVEEVIWQLVESRQEFADAMLAVQAVLERARQLD